MRCSSSYAVTLGCLSIPVIVVVGTLIWAWVFRQQWAWFIAPTFGLSLFSLAFSWLVWKLF